MMQTYMKSGIYLVGKSNNLEFNLDEYLSNQEWYDFNGYSRWELHIARIPVSDAGSVKLGRIKDMLRRLDGVSDKVQHLKDIQDLIDRLIPSKCRRCGCIHAKGENTLCDDGARKKAAENLKKDIADLVCIRMAKKLEAKPLLYCTYFEGE